MLYCVSFVWATLHGLNKLCVSVILKYVRISGSKKNATVADPPNYYVEFARLQCDGEGFKC